VRSLSGWGFGLAACLLATPAWAQDSVQRFALLVGHNDGGGDRVALRYAHADASQMASVLSEIGGVAPEREWVLLDPGPEALSSAFDRAREALDAAEGRTEFVFYYSGHSDEEGLLLGDERFPYAELRQTLEALPARVRLAILDSCASGALILSKGGRSVAPFLVDEASQHAGFAYLTSSSADEVAQEAERIGGSYFTHYLASGLRGAADASGDGRITLIEAYSYANAQTLARTERTQYGPQHARYETQLSGTGDYVLTDLSLTNATMVLEAGLAGQALVRDERGVLVVELDKEPGRAVELGLPEGRYTVTLVDSSDDYGEAVVHVAAGASALLLADDLVWRTGEATVARGATTSPPAAVVGLPIELPALMARGQLAPGLPASGGSPDHLLFGLAGADTVELRTLGVAMGWVEADRSRGLAAAMGATLAGELDGVQTSFGVNVVREGGAGGQLSGAVNVVGAGFDGVQTTGGVNVAGGVVRGGQLSMGGNFAGDGVRGAQVSLGVNQAGGAGSEGLQLSTLNVAGGFGGLQLGLVNIGRNVGGAQIGLVNIAGEVSGAQIGLVNVAKDVKGTPIGLVSVEKEGRHDVLVYATEADPANVELRFGGDYLYTVLGAGGLPDQAYLAVGLGVHAPMQKLWLDFDAVGAGYMALGTTTLGDGSADGPFGQPPTGVMRGRATLGWQMFPQFAPFVGVGVNMKIPTSRDQLAVEPAYLTPKGEGPRGETYVRTVWPLAFAGLQF
jgi:hypothetical protein